MLASNPWHSFKKYWNSSSPDNNSTGHLEKILPQHPFFLQAISLSKYVFVVIDIKKMQYLHVSSNVKDISGWTQEDYMKGGVEFAFSVIRKEAQPGIIHFSKLINEYFKMLPAQERQDYRCYWDYQVTGPTGANTLLQQDYALRYDEEGAISILLAICTYIKNYKNDKSMHLRLTNGKENLIYEFELGKNKLNKLEALSNRELEIAQLINQSQDSIYIADKLNISVLTVNTHRRNMLKKLNVKDSLELCNLLKVLGFV